MAALACCCAAAAQGTLTLEVSFNGQPAAGTVRWRASAAPPRWPEPLARGPGVEERSHDGTATIPVAAGQTLWLFVDSGGFRRAWRKVRPFASEQRLAVAFPARGRDVHAFVLREDLAGSKATPVRLVRVGAPDDARSGVTDDGGYVRFAAVPPGRYQVLPEGSGTREPAPYSARVDIGRGPGGKDALTVLFAKGAQGVAHITTNLQGKVMERSPLLALRRLDPGPFRRFYVLGVLNPGITSFEAKVPAGDYQVQVIDPSRRATERGIAVTVEKHGIVHEQVVVEPVIDLSTLVLTGLPQGFFNVLVQSEDLLDDGSSKRALGRQPWGTPRAAVALPTDPFRPVALVGGKPWLAATPVDPEALIGPGPHEVAMVEGCRLTVRWLGALVPAGVDPMLEVKSEHGQFIARWRGALARVDGVTRPVYEATLYVPRGALELTIIGVDRPPDKGSKRVRAAGPAQVELLAGR